MDEILSEFLNNARLAQYPIAEHLQGCPSVRRIPDTQRGITCDHDYLWGLNFSEQVHVHGGL